MSSINLAYQQDASIRPLAEKVGDIVNIKDFGAVCDGETDDTDAVHAAMNVSDTVFVPGHTRANIVWPRAGVRLVGDGVAEFHQTSFEYVSGTLIEAHDTALPAVTINPDTAGQNLHHIGLENLCVAGRGRIGDAIAIDQTTGAFGVADLVLRNVSTRSALAGLRIDCEVLWATFDHLTHDFCFDGCVIETNRFVNGIVASVWAARRCYRHGFYWKKTYIENSGFQAWSIGLLSADYNGDFNSTGAAQAGVFGVYINGFEGLDIGELVAEGNGLGQPTADGHGVLIEGGVNRSINIRSAAIESNPIPFRWKGDVASGFLDNFYRFSSPTHQVPGIISATYAMENNGTEGGPKITVGRGFQGEMRTLHDLESGGYSTSEGMDYIPALTSGPDPRPPGTLNLAHRSAVTINCGVESHVLGTLTLARIGQTVTLFSYAAATANTVTLNGGLMWDGNPVVIAANQARAFIVLGFPYEGKLIPVT